MICKDVKKPSAKFHLKKFRNDITFYDQYKKNWISLINKITKVQPTVYKSKDFNNDSSIKCQKLLNKVNSADFHLFKTPLRKLTTANAQLKSGKQYFSCNVKCTTLPQCTAFVDSRTVSSFLKLIG